MTYLNKGVKDSVQKYLGTMTFEEASTWMDDVRSDHSYDYMKTWHYAVQRGNLPAVSRELTVSKGRLLLWKRNYESGILSTDGRSYEQEEIIRLRKELKDAQLERDILKKAVSIFSKSDR
jgi:hypothetical protein